ncbi:hypothetical protein JAAARDRAFT_491846 [Jaapia argillacea MUCL 33604]|uniref:Uncharacterized protein n=1 Tax=Jaapia argillacea MUCL 33604 TaxID=933084 RepID=A0A067PLS8_9AGAM|nr:hypothetical protein JAAARDRAFT_491846 [Jaapia argillacea MUCL 33604]
MRLGLTERWKQGSLDAKPHVLRHAKETRPPELDGKWNGVTARSSRPSGKDHTRHTGRTLRLEPSNRTRRLERSFLIDCTQPRATGEMKETRAGTIGLRTGWRVI